MSSPRQESEPQLSDIDRVIRDRLDIRRMMADCAQRVSDVNQEYQQLIGLTLENDAEMKRLGIDKAAVLPERAMPEGLAGPDAPVLWLVET
jgi:hypothetical protein